MWKLLSTDYLFINTGKILQKYVLLYEFMQFTVCHATQCFKVHAITVCHATQHFNVPQNYRVTNMSLAERQE